MATAREVQMRREAWATAVVVALLAIGAGGGIVYLIKLVFGI